ncbi:dual specificity phosphatase [Geopyxis carbonaria]|nr:dual specificity phosphatase [Geopyxis carbonaria]
MADDDVFLLSSPRSSFPSTLCKDLLLPMPSTRNANSPSLKRTYTLVSSNPPSPSEQQDLANPFQLLGRSTSTKRSHDNRMSLSLKRRYPFCQTQTTSLAATESPLSTPSPTFVSVFESDIDMSGCSPVKIHHSTLLEKNGTCVMTQSPLLSLEHQLLDTDGSSTSSSSNTSPTTTVSTVESVSTEDQTTPQSSPETPETKMSSFRSRSRVPDNLAIVPPSPRSGSSRPLSPSKKPRNTKNLSLNVPPPAPSPIVAQFSSKPTEDADHSGKSTPKSISAPSSPAFIVPPPPQNPRRRPSTLGLTIKLPGTLSDAPRSGVNALRHHQSSPSLFSPGPRGGPPGGMTLPQSASFKQTSFQFQRPHFNTRWAAEGNSTQSSSSSNSPPKSPEILHEMDEEEEHEPRSGEAKSPAYPAGPALIFEPNIYLYAEPDAELASQFDVVINVAREVLNPFKASPQIVAQKSVHSPIPDTACTESSFKTAFEDSAFSPISTYARVDRPKNTYREPEYVHMPWDHNTPILDDLPSLVELISKRSDEGKKVLVHCQCGVSRSATLLIAYSMYKNPEKPMQDAYSAVKDKSRWIGPNMSLIYQLTDWKKMITSEPPKTAAFGGWRGGVGSKNMMRGAPTAGLGRGRGLDIEIGTDPLAEPQTAPLPDRGTAGFPAASPLMPPNELRSTKPQMVRTRSENGGFISAISPGPSSAPPGMMSLSGSNSPADNRQSWPEGDAKFKHLISSEPSPKMPQQSWSLSMTTREREPQPPPTLMAPPPPPRQTHSYTLEKSEPSIPGAFMLDPDDNLSAPNPNVASPRNSGFWATVPSRRSGPWGFFTDPRSPTEGRTQNPIVRNIFDVL